jgi:hypothetical protein
VIEHNEERRERFRYLKREGGWEVGLTPPDRSLKILGLFQNELASVLRFSRELS